MPSVTLAAKKFKGNNTQFADRSTRLLLALWGWEEPAILKGKLTDRLKRRGEKSSDYQEVFAQLQEKGAITIAQGKVALSSKGVDLLSQHLKGADLIIEGTIVGAWAAKALCKWIEKTEVAASMPKTNGKASSAAITSYHEFKPEAVALFEKLDKGYSYGGLVPIWHMRRELSDRVERAEFSDWMMEMQAEQEFYLQTGEAREATEDQKRDSITNEIRGLLFFVSKES